MLCLARRMIIPFSINRSVKTSHAFEFNMQALSCCGCEGGTNLDSTVSLRRVEETHKVDEVWCNQFVFLHNTFPHKNPSTVFFKHVREHVTASYTSPSLASMEGLVRACITSSLKVVEGCPLYTSHGSSEQIERHRELVKTLLFLLLCSV